MALLPDPEPEAWFNLAHSRTQVRDDMTVWILRAMFQRLYDLGGQQKGARDITVACVVLHNIARTNTEEY